jgi:1,6-anhydro-N-acetylmuramate kinase
VYVEDQAGARPDRLYLAGFGAESQFFMDRLAKELDVRVEVIPDDYPGLAGYLRSLSSSARSAQPARKVAA